LTAGVSRRDRVKNDTGSRRDHKLTRTNGAHVAGQENPNSTIGEDEVKAVALSLLEAAPDGEPLSEKTRALIAYALRMSVAILDFDGGEAAARDALKAGASVEALHEVLALMSGLGVHSLMGGSPLLAKLARERDPAAFDAPLDAVRRALRDKYIGQDRYWTRFEQDVPGFLDALLRISPDAFEGFMIYCAIPWRTDHVDALTKELIAIAADATSAHRYLPGLRLHLRNALRLGCGRTAILEALEIAFTAPAPRGVR
jgi:alkylhydroperoxidase/carboxymuconolactone decarboxylase family protein YurZ